MLDEFDVGLRAIFEPAREQRDLIRAAREQARTGPIGLAAKVLDGVPRQAEQARQIVQRLSGIDMATDDTHSAFEGLNLGSLVRAQAVSHFAERYRLWRALLNMIERCIAQQLNERKLADAICELFINALEMQSYLAAHELDVFARHAPVLAHERDAWLAGYMATMTSLTTNKRLRAAMDEIREHSPTKPAPRERFEQLLRELYVESPQVWKRGGEVWGTWPDGLRTEVARRLEKPGAPPKETELATFAERERLLKRGRDASLPPREFQILGLLVENPRITSAGIAQRLGISASAVRTLKSRIKKALDAA